MLNIYSVLGLNEIVFDNEKWQKTVFIDLSEYINSRIYSSFYSVSINKSIVQENIEGLFYVLQRLCFQFERWEHNEDFKLSKQQFIDFVLFEGYLTQHQGVLIDIKDFKNEIESLKVVKKLPQLKNI